TGQAFSQISIQGKVISQQTGETLPGVNILVKNSGLGTITDMDGRYSLNVPGENAILVLSFSGFTPLEVPVNGRTTIDVTMTEDLQNLEEVVVVGYTSKQLSEISSSVSVVSAEELNDVTS